MAAFLRKDIFYEGSPAGGAGAERPRGKKGFFGVHNVGNYAGISKLWNFCGADFCQLVKSTNLNEFFLRNYTPFSHNILFFALDFCTRYSV